MTRWIHTPTSHVEHTDEEISVGTPLTLPGVGLSVCAHTDTPTLGARTFLYLDQ